MVAVTLILSVALIHGEDAVICPPNELSTRLARLDAKYQPGRRQSHQPGATVTRVGTAPVIITAPHSAPTRRAGRGKRAEVRVGALAELLAEIVDGTVVMLLRDHPGSTNAEAVVGAAVDPLLVEHPPLVFLDLHGMSGRHGMDVCLGSGGHSGRGPLIAALHDLLAPTFTVTVDRPFAAGPRTLTSLVAARLPAVQVCQIELGPRLRHPLTPEADLHHLLGAVASAFNPGAPARTRLT